MLCQGDGKTWIGLEIERLLDLDFGADGFQLLLDLFGFFLGDALLERLRSLFDESLGFGEAEAGDNAADFLNCTDLIGATFKKDDIKFGLLDCCRSSGTTTTTSGGNGNGSSGANAPLRFEGLHQFSDFQDGKAAKFINDFIQVCHSIIFSISVRQSFVGFKTSSRWPGKELFVVFGSGGPEWPAVGSKG